MAIDRCLNFNFIKLKGCKIQGGNTEQWSLYFKTTHGTKKMWSYIAGGLKIKVN